MDAAGQAPAEPDAAAPDAAPAQGLLRRFGSRNHPKTLERKARLQKARAGMAATPEMLANYTAVRAFLYAEWLGALLCCASVALVYMFASPRASAPQPWAVLAPLAVFAAGGWLYLANHRYYKRLDFPWAKRWDTAAIVVAGSGAVFWLLFGLLFALWQAGFTVAPLS